MPIPSTGLKGAVLMREAVTEYKAIIDLVRGALAKKFYPLQTDVWVHIEAIYHDHMVIEKDGQLFDFPYAIHAQNAISFGDPIQVQETFTPMKEAQAIKGLVFVEAVGNENSGKWLIRVIKAGASGNGNYYPDAVLKEALPLFDGVRVFIKADAEHLNGGGKDPNKLIGRISSPYFTEGKSVDTGELFATFELMEPDGTVATKVREAYSRGMADLFGFSIDAVANAKKVKRNGAAVREATKFTKILSVDLIVEPGAGGQLIRMVEAKSNQSPNHQTTQEQENMFKARMLEAIKQALPAAFALIDPDTIEDDKLEGLYREALTTGGNVNVADALKTIRMAEAKSTINASTLPEKAKEKLIKYFSMREAYSDDDIANAIKDEREYLGNFTESGKPSNLNFGDGVVGDRSVVIADMLDAFFDPAHKNHRDVNSFKECYVEITGDKRVTGLMSNCDRSRMRESLGISMRESLDSTAWADALGNSVTRRMQAEYDGMTDLQSWRKVVSIGQANDFRTQERVRLGGYGNLPIVAERDGYSSLNSPGDDVAKYAVAKRGGTEDITLEMVKNDDVSAIRRVPTELSLAAANTLYEFVFDFFRLNPVGWDGVALYHASHNNLFTSALSASEFAAHRVAMLKQTRAGSGKRVNVPPASVLVPFEMQETAYNLFVRNQNLDKTFVQTINPEVIPVPYWTDATDWVTVANPNRGPVIEIAFLDGKQEPELFVQDLPTLGSMFSNDTLTYKIRHIYGGNTLVDSEKFTTKAVVAG